MMRKIRKLIRKRIMILEYEHDDMVTYMKSQFALFPKKYHDKYRKSLEHLRLNLAIKLWKLKIESWKALIREKDINKKLVKH